MKRIGHAIEMVISQSRWLILPFLIGLVVGLVYDQNAFYGRTRQAVYQVVFFDKKAEVRDNATGGVVKSFDANGPCTAWGATQAECGSSR